MFSKRLKLLREKEGISQEKLAADLNIPRSSITNYENSDDRIPRQERINKLADYFGVSIDYLMGRSDDPIEKEGKQKGEMYFFDIENVTPEEIEEAKRYIEVRRQMLKDKKNK